MASSISLSASGQTMNVSVRHLTLTGQQATRFIEDSFNLTDTDLVYPINGSTTTYLNDGAASRTAINSTYTQLSFALATSATRYIWFSLYLYYCPGGNLDFDFDWLGTY